MKLFKSLIVILTILLAVGFWNVVENEYVYAGQDNLKTVTVGMAAELETFDPAYETNIPSVGTMSNVYDKLVFRDSKENMEIVPALATSWEFTEPTTLKVNLREGVKFHNGDEMTADDVIFSFNRLIEGDFPLSTYVHGSISSVEKIDDYTINIHTPRPNAMLVPTLVLIPVLPEDAFQEMGSEQFGITPIGTGPFKVEDWQKDDRIVFVAFEEHWRGRADIDRLIVRPIPEVFSRLTALNRGEADIIVGLPPVRAPSVEEEEGTRVEKVVSARNMFVWLNTYEPPFDDVRVRRAMNHGVNPQEIVDAVLRGYGEPNPSVFNKTIFGYDLDIEPYEHDVEKAKALLEEAGYPDGFEVTLWGSGRYIMDREIQEAIAGQLSEIGVTVRHHIVEWAEFWGAVSAEEMDGMAYLGTGNPLLDADMTLGYRFHSERGGRYYENEEVDQLIEEQQAEIDTEKRLEILSEIQKILRDEAPWIFLHDVHDLYGVNERIQWTGRPDEMIWGYDISIKE